MTKQSLTKILFTILISIMGANVFAYDFSINNTDGTIFYYNYYNNGKELEFAGFTTENFDPIIGYTITSLEIPEEVTYMNRTRKVTSIGGGAFMSANYLKSVPLPNSITSIGRRSFENCSSLVSFSIPNSVISIGEYAFGGCTGLISVSIGNSVTDIKDCAFSGCINLSSINIPNSVISIGFGAFGMCENLVSMNIPNSVIYIKDQAFEECSRLATVNIGNSVTYIGSYSFARCSSLTSVSIGKCVTSIGDNAFYGCKELTSVTIPNSVISIGKRAFENVNLSTVITLIENPSEIVSKASENRTFSLNTFNNATLYVPVGSLDKYMNTVGWRDFLFIEEGTGPNGDGETPETKKCAKPTISYQNGKLIFNCATEGAVCQSTITDPDITTYSGNEVQLGVTYNIRAYATKEGYENSDVVTATLCWIDVEPKTEGITNNVASVRAQPILIQNNGSTLTISGIDNETTINVYNVMGRIAGSAKGSLGTTIIDTSLQIGEIGIVKIGNKTIKIQIK